MRATMHSDDEEASQKAYDYCDGVLWKRQDEIIDEIADLAPASLEGIRAKAQVVGVVVLSQVMSFVDQTFDEQAEDHEKLLVGLLRDIVGEAGLGWRMDA